MGNQKSSEVKKGWLNKSFDFISKHYLILSTIPLVTGGVHQLFNLYQLGNQFLRFFSVSQLIVDGVIILIYILVITAIISFFGFLNQLFFNHVYVGFVGMTSYNDEIEIKRKKKWNLIIANIISGIIIVILFSRKKHEISDICEQLFFHLNPLNIGYFSMLHISPSYELWLLLFFIIFLTIGNINARQERSYQPRPTEMLLWLAYFPFIVFLPRLLFSNSFSLTNLNSTINYDKFTNCVKLENPNYNSVEIAYYNDKYIFSKLYSENDTIIKISNFEDFIDTSNCSEN